jgi:hypothetical protein
MEHNGIVPPRARLRDAEGERMTRPKALRSTAVLHRRIFRAKITHKKRASPYVGRNASGIRVRRRVYFGTALFR